MTKYLLLGEAEKFSDRLPATLDEEQREAIAEKRARQGYAAQMVRRYELMRLFGGRDQLDNTPAAEVECLWLVHQAWKEAEAEANRRAAEKS